MSPVLKTCLRFALLTGLYLAGGVFASSFVAQPDQVALIWPPAGIGFATLLLFGVRWWPVIVVGQLILHLFFTPVPGLFLPYSLAANLFGTLAGVLLVRWLDPQILDRLSVRIGLNLMLGAALMSAVSALIGASGMIHAGMAPYELWPSNFAIWLLSDLFGAIAVVPTYLLLARRLLRPRSRPERSYASGTEKVIWLASLALAIAALLWAGTGSPVYALGLASLPMSLLLWSALRFEPLLTAAATTAMALLVAAVAGLGIAGFSAPGDALDASLLLGFLCVTATVPQMLAAISHVSKVAAEQLLLRARTDALTGLPNRSAFEEHVRAAGKPGEGLAIAYLDLDQFKLVNDTLSHATGDELIRELSGVLGSILRPGDMLARIGGDEFGVLLREVDAEAAIQTAERLREGVAALRFPCKDRIITPTASIGLVCYQAGSRSFGSLLTEADSACFAAKELGGNRIQTSHHDDSRAAERSAAMDWALRIGEALDSNALELFAQSMVALDAGPDAPRQMEILLRMRDKDSGQLLPPAQFISAAERFGLAVRLDRHVVNQVISALETQPESLRRLSRCSINLSAATLMDDGFVAFLRRRLSQSKVPASLLCFEITETSAVRDLKRAQDMIAAVHALGCRFALDDFGTGFCSFAYLQQLQVDSFKIDGSFVREAHKSPLSMAIVRAIIEIARVLKRQTVAEGVENEAQLRQMRALGADYAQGFHLGHPMPLAQWFDESEPMALRG